MNSFTSSVAFHLMVMAVVTELCIFIASDQSSGCLYSGLLLHIPVMPLLFSLFVVIISQPMAMMKRNGKGIHLWFTLVLMLKGLVRVLPQTTVQSNSLYSILMTCTILGGIPVFHDFPKRFPVHTVKFPLIVNKVKV